MFWATMCPSSGETTLYLCDTWCLLFCMDDCLVCRVCTLHTRQSSIQNNEHQISHKYSYFSWWWAHCRPKHVEKINWHTKKNCAQSWLYLQDYTGMYGQQTLKICIRVPEDNMEQSRFEKQIVPQLVKFPAFRGTHSFIILPTTHISAFHPPPHYILFLAVYFDIILHSTSRPSSYCLTHKLFYQKPVSTFSLHHTCCKPRWHIPKIK